MTELILIGDALEKLKEVGDGTVDCCVTSPPYYGLRDYGVDGQIGLEETPEQYISKLVAVFREVRRVLRDDGTLWVNIGDSYAGNNSRASNNGRAGFGNPREKIVKRGGDGIKDKDLIGIPWMLAFALRKPYFVCKYCEENIEQEDAIWDEIAEQYYCPNCGYPSLNRENGWYLRQDIIWHKPNPMPESVKDRCTKSHEYIFMLSKSPKYYYDADAIKEPCVNGDSASPRRSKGAKTKNSGRRDKQGELGKQTYTGFNERYFAKPALTHRNKRDVWTVTTKPYKGSHFATFPPDLIEPCILAGSRVGGVVLEPFMGSGTTCMVAKQNGRGYIGIELNTEYVELAKKRIREGTKDGTQMSIDAFAV